MTIPWKDWGIVLQSESAKSLVIFNNNIGAAFFHLQSDQNIRIHLVTLHETYLAAMYNDRIMDHFKGHRRTRLLG